MDLCPLRTCSRRSEPRQLGPSGWTPRDGLEGLLATSQLLKTKENKKNIEMISITIKQDIPICVNIKGIVWIRGLGEEL